MVHAPPVLSASELERVLRGLPGWSVMDSKLHKEFVFADFVEAFGFMTRVALAAERADHHPEWCNVYRTVRVDLTTHVSGGVTERDVRLAQEMDRLAGGS